jgi:hypothetical protein
VSDKPDVQAIPWPKFFSGVAYVCPVCGLKYETEIGLKTRCRHAEPEVIPEQAGEEFDRKTKNVFKYLQLLFPGEKWFRPGMDSSAPNLKPERIVESEKLTQKFCMASDAADCFQKICDFENQGIHAVCVPEAAGTWSVWRYDSPDLLKEKAPTWREVFGAGGV